MSENVSVRTCVVLKSAAQDDIVVQWISRVAEEQGYVITSPDAELAPGATLLDSITSAIQGAAVVVAVLSRAADERKRNDWASNATVWFELGIAVATRRAILIILSDDDIVVPTWASDLQIVGPTISSDAFSRALRQAIRRPVGALEPGAIKTGVPLGAKASSLEASLKSLPQTPAGGGSGLAFESWFSDLLRDAAVPFEQSSPIEGEELPRAYRELDFAVSADELSANLGDPLPVELALGLADRLVVGRRKTFRTYLRATGANLVLVVSLSKDQTTSIWSVGIGDVLACSALRLVQEMRSATFGEAILALRNSAEPEAVAK